MSVYLDWNSTTPPHASVLARMQAAAVEAWGNPSSVHAAGRRARALVESARDAIGSVLGFDARDVILTGGGTEANNLALRGAAALVTSRIEHPSVVRVAEALAAAGRPVEWLPVGPAGRIDPADVAAALERVPRGATVALMAVNHETGVVQPVAEVAGVAHAAGARLHSDAVQAVGRVEARVWAGADSVALAGHKVRGPKGIGALAWKGAPPAPVLLGGAQERGARPGTVDPVAAAGLGAALERLDPARWAGLAPLRDRLEAALGGQATVNGRGAPRAPHVTSLWFPGSRGDELVAALDLEGVMVSSGAACSAGTQEPSPVVAAMLGPERAASTIRVSLGEETTSADVERAILALLRVLSRRP
jgi:cysteine desulfurase